MSEPNWEPLAASPIDYVGDWSNTVLYQPGQVVRYNGIDYIAVNPSIGQTPPAVVTTPYYGTSLPTSPAHGQEAILVDSATNPSYQWRFRYNAYSTSSYKWEFIGGSPARASVEAAEVASTSYADLATVGPQFTIPRSGEYDIWLSMYAAMNNVSNWTLANAVLQANGVTINPPVINPLANCYPTVVPYFTMSDGARVALASGIVLKPVYQSVASGGGTGTVSFGRRRLIVTPVRVS